MDFDYWFGAAITTFCSIIYLSCLLTVIFASNGYSVLALIISNLLSLLIGALISFKGDK